MASAGFPGISRGSRKLRVSATHSVRTKKPRRRSAYLKLVRSWFSGSFSGRVPGLLGGERSWHAAGFNLLGCQVQQHLLVVRVGVRGRLGVRVAWGGPAGEGPGV